MSLSVFGNSNARIRFTVDGSDVCDSSPVYTRPLQVSSGWRLRAASDVVGLEMSREFAIDF